MDQTSNSTTNNNDPESPPLELPEHQNIQNDNENSTILSENLAVDSSSTTILPGYKRPRYSQYQGKQKSNVFNFDGGFLEFKESSPPTPPAFIPVLSGLNLDERFFPSGIKPGHVVEVKGPENSGKTFLLTYFLAQLLLRYPSKTAVIIDTSHQFSLRNLVSIIARGDNEIGFDTPNSSLTLSEILESYPKLNDYLDRLFVIKCYSAEEFILTLGPLQNSLIEKMIRSDPNLSLVAIDTVDNYSFAESFSPDDPKRYPNIMDLVTKAVSSARTPLICTTIMQLGYRARKAVVEDDNAPNEPGETEPKSWYSNIVMEAKYFTHSLSVVPSTKAEKDTISRAFEFRNAHHATAYLRSKHKANMAGSANHRVKFSIFSDMLWVDVPEEEPKELSQ